jgi:hypothetical protein
MSRSPSPTRAPETTPATATATPALTLVGSTNSFPKFDELNKALANYPDWSNLCADGLRLVDLWDYTCGDTEKPTNPDQARIWTKNDEKARACIRMRIDAGERAAVSELKTSKEVWDSLLDRHRKEGAITQVSLFEKAFATRYSSKRPHHETTAIIRDLVNHIFTIGMPNQDAFLTICLLTAMSGELDHIRMSLDTLFANGTLTPTAIFRRLDTEDERTQHSQGPTTPPANQAMAASRPKQPSPVCANCNRTGHTKDKCWQPGGGGEKPEWAKLRDAERTRTRSRPPQRLSYQAGQPYSITYTPIPSRDGSPTPSQLPLTHMDRAALAITPTDEMSDWDDENASHLDVRALSASERTSQPVTHEPYFFDTAANNHSTPSRADFSNLRSIAPRQIQGFTGSSVQAIGIGEVTLRCGKGSNLTLRDVLYVPDSTVRLISIGALCDDLGIEATFQSKSCSIQKPGGKVIANGTRYNKSLYSYNGRPPIVQHANITRPAPDIHTWHLRLGHPDVQTIIDMAKTDRAEGMPINLSKLPAICEHCILGKQTKAPVPKRREGERAKAMLDLVFIDLMGPMDVKSAGGKLYSMDLVDDCTSLAWSILLAKKSDAYQALREWEAARLAETGLLPGIYRTDSGTELSNAETEAWLQTNGIWHELSAPYTSAHIGKVERMHRTIMNRARAMRSQAQLPPNMWGECVLTACYLANRTASSALDGKTPYEAWHQHKPNLSHLHEFGSRAFVLIQNQHNPKIYNRSLECVLVGYAPNAKAYRCYERSTGRVIVTRNVVFIESQNAESSPLYPGMVLGKAPQATGTPDESIDEPESLVAPVPPVAPALPIEPPAPPPADQNMPPDPDPGPRRSTRAHAPTAKAAETRGIARQTRLDDALAGVRAGGERLQAERARRREQNPPGNAPMSLATFEADDPDEPDSLAEALSSPSATEWRAALEEEFDSIKRMGVYKLVPRSAVPAGRTIMKGRPVFRKKRNELGDVVRHKARWVCKGYSAVFGQDYNKTTSPTARLESLRVILHIGAAMDWDIQQIDIKTAYLYGLLEEECWMEQPEGFEEPGKEDWV